MSNEKKKMNKAQEDKLRSVGDTLKDVVREAAKHITSDEVRVLKLSDLQLILGTVQIMYEDQIMKEAGILPATQEQIKEQHKSMKEEEFEKAEEMIDKTKPVTYH